jgi:hypothetical protein
MVEKDLAGFIYFEIERPGGAPGRLGMNNAQVLKESIRRKAHQRKRVIILRAKIQISIPIDGEPIRVRNARNRAGDSPSHVEFADSTSQGGIEPVSEKYLGWRNT